MAVLFLALTLLVPDAAIDAIIRVESKYNAHATSRAGAQGLMQIMPHTARDPGYGIQPLHRPYDPKSNRRFGREYFGALIRDFGSVRYALMAYNWGPERVRAWIRAGKPTYRVPLETKRYVSRLESVVVGAIEDKIWLERWRSLKRTFTIYSPPADKTWQTGLASISISITSTLGRSKSSKSRPQLWPKILGRTSWMVGIYRLILTPNRKSFNV